MPRKGLNHTVLIDTIYLDKIWNDGKLYVFKNCNIYYCNLLNYNKDNKDVSLHRLITNAPKGMVVDHKNRNGLDCRLTNLQIVTNQENCQNKIAKTPHGAKNVHWDKSINKWRVSVHHNNKRIRAGNFSDFNEAKECARQLRIKIHSNCPENAMQDMINEK